MSAIGWFVLLGVVVVLLCAGGAVLALRSADRSGEHVLEAEPEDRPLAAVVVNPVKVDDAARDQMTAVCTGLGWAPPLWLPTSKEAWARTLSRAGAAPRPVPVARPAGDGAGVGAAVMRLPCGSG